MKFLPATDTPTKQKYCLLTKEYLLNQCNNNLEELDLDTILHSLELECSTQNGKTFKVNNAICINVSPHQPAFVIYFEEKE